jgi:hypothetical protein
MYRCAGPTAAPKERWIRQENAVRLDGVEVKVSLEADQTAEAMRVLGLGDVAPWSIFFVEDVTPGLCPSTPLLDGHLIIRARQKTKGKDDVTIKFRPARRSQLTGSWLATTKTDGEGPDSELKVEQDWAGERRTLSISLTAERPDGLVADVAASDRDVRALLTGDQRRLVEDCSGMLVNLAALTVLPPVSAMRWPTFDVAAAGDSVLEVRAERWTWQELDFLELSIAVAAVETAQAAQAGLVGFVESKGLQPSSGAPKTTLVLQRLVAEAACSAR